ncbi:hypothetical protein FSP39_005253 [Pinctada imbricata]|uniref:LRAT domain-containing protein n=1 Tax=Pinctada imbricata TaxID=66713 RepID=A0AA88XI18_PINIB|nr:hypothetical protein FSP39_005253 [Pinctada imbricata]
MCMVKNGKKGKRSAPSRYTLQLDHRFIYYDGWYFEFGIFGGKSVGIFNRMALASDRCPSRIERRPAGYSRVSVDCLKRCTNSYRREFGKYNLLSNNCHHFANYLARVLYYYSTGCPSWCY